MLSLGFVGAPLEMTKRRWKELMKALYENHFDPRKDEELKQSKIDIENKLPKILKLVKERRQNRKNRNSEANLRKESELIELIENFHKQYQFVYDQYNDIRGQLIKTANEGKEDEGYFTATSSSDSDTESEKVVNKDEQLTPLTRAKKSFISEYLDAMAKVRENENIVQELKEKLENQGKEVSFLAQKQKLYQRKISGLMKELELDLCSFNVSFDGVCSGKRDSRQQAANKEREDQVSELEEIAKEMDEKMSELLKGGISEQDELIYEVPKFRGLIEQINNLKGNLDCLIKTQESDLKEEKARQSDTNSSSMNENLLDQVNKTKSDLESMRKKNAELESEIQKKSHEISEFLTQIDDLKKEVAYKSQELQKMQKEKEDSEMRVRNLELEAHKLSSQNSESEKQIARNKQEYLQITQELEALQGKVVEMEKMVKEREDRVIVLQKRLENDEDQEHKSKNKLPERLKELENHNNELSAKVLNQHNLLKQQEETINKLKGDCKMVQGRFLQLADRKMNEVGEEFRKNFEDKLRLLSRRIRVSEQLHAENKENWKRLKEDCEQNHPGIGNRLSEILRNEAEQRAVSQAFDEMMKGLECLTKEIESKEGFYLQRLSRLSNEVQAVKNCVHSSVMDDNKLVENGPLGSVVEHKMEENDQDKVAELEKVISEKDEELLRLENEKLEAIRQLENEKVEAITQLENEKVEAIRQLCIWVDYHQSRFDQLKEEMMKKANGRGRA